MTETSEPGRPTTVADVADARLVAAAALVRTGRVWELGHELHRGMPVHPHHPSFTLSLSKRHGDAYREGGYSTANDLIVLSGHHGTHMDALGHVSVHGRLHGGVDADRAQRGLGGLTSGDIASQAPLVARGVLVDVPRLLGVDELDPGYLITPEELDAATEKAGVRLRPGDVALFRTGWARRWERPADFFPDGLQPGPGEAVARRLSAAGVIAAGSDTMSFESVAPGQNAMPCHVHLLQERGIPIMEMLDLEAVAAAGLHEFLFVALPLRLRGATGSPVRPVAIA